MDELNAFFLVGPTATGKTSVSQWIAEHYSYDILSADAMMVYRDMDIGTAKPGKIFRYVSFIKGYGNHFHSIEKTDKISKGDMLILDAEDDLKDGAEVVYQQLHWRFTVNEKVKITISGLNKPGFYVPFTAIFNQYLGTPQICIVRNGKAVFADIKQNGLHGEYIRIESDSIKEGDQVVLDSNNALQNVYEGAELKVLKAMEAPIKLNHNVAKAYNPVTAPIQSVKVVE